MANKLVKALKKHKEGLLIGAIVGAIAAYYLVSKGQDLSTLAATSKSLLDNVLGRSANPLADPVNKLYAVFIVIGSSLGYAFDALLGSFLRKTRKRWW